MASYDKSKDANYTLAVQSALKTLGANLGAGGVDGKWGAYTERAYQQNRQAVDALVSGLGFTSAGSFAGAEAGGGLAPQFTPQLVDVPEQRSFSDWLAVGQEIYAAQYEAGRQSAQRRLEAAQAANEENRVQSAARLETAANARGFGRSSYATDMLQRNEYEANRNEAALQGDYADALLQLEAGRNASAAQYAGSMWQSQQQAVLEAQRFTYSRVRKRRCASGRRKTTCARHITRRARPTQQTPRGAGARRRGESPLPPRARRRPARCWKRRSARRVRASEGRRESCAGRRGERGRAPL